TVAHGRTRSRRRARGWSRRSRAELDQPQPVERWKGIDRVEVREDLETGEVAVVGEDDDSADVLALGVEHVGFVRDRAVRLAGGGSARVDDEADGRAATWALPDGTHALRLLEQGVAAVEVGEAEQSEQRCPLLRE